MRDAQPGQTDAAGAFEREAEAYAAADDAKPFHAHYERPAVTALLPPLAGLAVLDAGCGPGWYTQYLTERYAEVTAIDASAKMVAITRARAGGAEVLQADLRQPLPFSPASFDLVVCSLVLHYLENWEGVFGELARVLKPGGLFLLSLPHPFADFRDLKLDSYLGAKRLTVERSVGPVTLYARPVSALTEALAVAGFVVERLLEPLPTPHFERAEPELFERLSKMPGFLVVRARKE